jgi:hypothetical protein
MSENKFEIRITADAEGNETKLRAMSLKESKAFVVLLNAMTKIVERTKDHDKLTINVREGSAAVAIHGDRVDAVLEHFVDIKESKSGNAEMVDAFRDIQNIFRLNGLSYTAEFDLAGEVTDVFKDFKRPKTFRTKVVRLRPEHELVFINGKLLEVGGIKPNFHILTLKGEKVNIDCTESDATRVNSLLYKEIYITAWRSQKTGYTAIHKFCDHYKVKDDFDKYKHFIESCKDVSYFEYVGMVNERLKTILKSKDMVNARAFMKLFNHESSEEGVLRMILILTKFFKDNSNVVDVRESIKSIVEKKRRSQLV